MKNFGKTSVFAAAGMIISFLVTLACILTGSYINEGYNVAVGKVSTDRIVAPRQIENTYATDKKRLEAVSNITPLYKLDQSVSEKVRSKISGFFDELEERKAQADEIQAELESVLEEVETDAPVEQPVDESNEEQEDKQELVASEFLISREQFNNYCNLPRATRISLRDEVLAIAEAVMENGIKDEVDAKSLLQARDALNKNHWPAEIINLGYTVVTSALEPNLVVDEDATAAATEARIQQVQPVIILEGQKIVDANEIITEEAYWLLTAFGLVADSSINVYEIAGAAILTLLIFIVFSVYAYVFYNKLLNSRKEIALLCILYLTGILMFRLMSQITYLIIPLTVPIILIAVLHEQKFAIFMNFLITFLGALIYKGSIEFLIYFIITGSVAVLISRFAFERTKIIIAGLIICAANFVLVVGLNAFYYRSLDPDMMFNAVIAVSNGLLSLLIAIGSIPIWEALFDIITPVKLLDLTNPNNTLLRRLTIEAPGTYHHSLIVANLAEQAAHDIGANAPLARVGGYYHDIGKLKYPYYFGENQVGTNPHDHFDPYDSARLIMQHVPLGVEYADTYKLPRPIKDIILQHHGTTVIQYFYHKACEIYSEEEVQKEDFRYKGVIPSSKEAAIVMMADTAEAAVRSMITSSKNLEDVDEFLEALIRQKFEDAQLNESMLTLTELGLIRKSFMKIFRGMYHERVKYPDNPEKDSGGTVSRSEPAL